MSEVPLYYLDPGGASLSFAHTFYQRSLEKEGSSRGVLVAPNPLRNLGFRGVECRVSGVGCRMSGVGCRVKDVGCGVQSE